LYDYEARGGWGLGEGRGGGEDISAKSHLCEIPARFEGGLQEPPSVLVAPSTTATIVVVVAASTTPTPTPTPTPTVSIVVSVVEM